MTGTVQDELPGLNYSVLRRQARSASDGCSSAVVIVARCLVVNSDDLVKDGWTIAASHRWSAGEFKVARM